MILTGEMVERVNQAITEKRNKRNITSFPYVQIYTWRGRTAVEDGDTGRLVCEIEDLSQLIDLLTIIKEAMRENTGLVL